MALIKIKNLKHYLVAFLLLSCSAYSGNSILKNFYIGTGFGYGQTALSRPAQVATFDRNGIAWSFFVGDQFFSHVGIEFGYNRLANVIAAGIISGSFTRAVIQPSITYLAIRGVLPFSKRLSLFAKLGAAYSFGKQIIQIKSSIITSATGKIVGYGAIGISYKLSPKVAAYAELANTLKDGLVPRITVGTVGFTVKLFQ